MIRGIWVMIVLGLVTAVAVPAAAEPRHALAMHGEPALTEGFPHFPYVRPDAPKGGRLTLGSLGSFDSTNPFIVRGVSAQGLREYVFESLMARSADEPFTLYGRIAERIDVSPARDRVTFHLDPAARFSDGTPITSADVAFSREILQAEGWPYHRTYYAKVARTEVPDARTITFHLGEAGDRELPLILALMPILPRHLLTRETMARTSLEAPVGSGPYRVASVDAGRQIVYRRNVEHWARERPPLRGRYNFDEVRIVYYRDAQALFEAFATGEIDARVEDDPNRWAEGYAFPAATQGRIVRREVEIGLPAGFSALVFNTRRWPFTDVRVRAALIAAFDFNWVNRSLFDGLYRRTESLFARSDLAAVGRPADTREQALLAPFAGAVRPEIMAGSYRFPGGDGTGANRDALRTAMRGLAAAGFVLDGDVLTEKATGRPLAFEFLASSRAQERLMLVVAQSWKRLGIVVRIRQVDAAQYWSRVKSFDFDMMQWAWGASLSPGNEQLNRWSSASADNQGSLNYAGVRSPAADAMIAALLAAETRGDFVSAVRALDRVILSGDYAIPLFHLPRQWIAAWRHLRYPAQTPLFGTDFDTWWREDTP